MKAKPVLKKIAIREALFVRSFKLAKSNPSKTGLMILFDILFIASFFGLQALSQYFAQSLVLPTTLYSATFFLVSFSLAYYLLILLAYSFFKYCVLDSIKSLFEKQEFSLRRFGQFYSLNIIIAGIFFAILLVFNLILANIKSSYAPFVFIFMAIPYILLLYIVSNIAHSLFYEGASIKSSIKESFKTTFTKMKAYRETILMMILASLALWLLFFGSGYLISLLGSKNYNLYLAAYAYFRQASIVIFDIMLYFIILINRVSFYAISRELQSERFK
ncbi:hypothetical protein HYX08_00750 [Candidatus Woesearchaeota archaeon]|nr:hypothetical protein [Candidatus Woesearchaeota archaeon]